jgi:NAD-reducing hydrogenase small subunit
MFRLSHVVPRHGRAALELAKLIDVVYSPIVDAKEFPDEVDIALVEGAVASVDDEKKIKKVRAHSKMLIAMGDCAITGNVPSMRNPIGPEAILDRAYIENASACSSRFPASWCPSCSRSCVPSTSL